MTDEGGVAMFELCGERRATVGFMCFHGLHRHVEDIKELMRASPRTPVMIDHFGFCKGVDDPNWKGTQPHLKSVAKDVIAQFASQCVVAEIHRMSKNMDANLASMADFSSLSLAMALRP